MKAVILNGRLTGDSQLDDVERILIGELEEAGWKARSFPLRNMNIRPCIGCFGCWVETPGQCKIDDDSRELARSFIGSNLVIFLTPVTFGGYSSELKKGLDRCICIVSPFFERIDGEVHHQKRYLSYPSLLGLGVQSREDPESSRLFGALVHRNAINMHSPEDASVVLLRSEEMENMRAKLRLGFERLEVA